MEALRCPSCKWAFKLSEFDGSQNVVSCERCKRRIELRVLPALLVSHSAPPKLELRAPQEGESSCFYSPEHVATADCSHCGVLISEFWKAQWGNSTVCLKCLDHLRTKNQDQRFETQRTLWDSVALGLAVLPGTLIFWWLTLLTAPATLVFAIWAWKKPRSLVPRGPWRLILAMLLALLQMAAIGTMIYGIFQQ
jgi:hypothetical protein